MARRTAPRERAEGLYALGPLTRGRSAFRRLAEATGSPRPAHAGPFAEPLACSFPASRL